MTEINGINYFRRYAVNFKYPELEHGKGKDYYIYNMDRNPDSETYGKEKIDWNTDKYPQPTDEEMLEWYAQKEYFILRKYDALQEQIDRLWHDIDEGNLDKTGEFYLKNKEVKDKYPKG